MEDDVLAEACRIARHMARQPLSKEDATYWLIRLCKEMGFALDSVEMHAVLHNYNESYNEVNA